MFSIHDLWRHSQQGSPCTEKSISMMEDCYTNEGTQRINMRSLFSPTTITLYSATESNAASSFETGFAYQNEYNYKNGYVLSCIFSLRTFFRFRGFIALSKYNILYRFPACFYLLQSFHDWGVVLNFGNPV